MNDVLSQADRQSPLWLKLKQYCEARQAELQAKLATDLSPEMTAKVRGQLLETRQFLELEKDKPLVEKMVPIID